MIPRRVHLLVLMSILALIGSGCAPAEPAPGTTDFEFVTDSGMTVRMIVHEGSGLFASNVFVGAGSTRESDATAGSSHFLEHLLFNGTSTMTQEELYAAADRIGAYNNATTRREYTHYMMVAPQEELGAALGIQSAMLLDSTLPVEKFEKERGIVLEEMNRDADNPASERGDRLHAMLEAENANFLRPVLGTPESIAALPRDEVIAYYHTQYVPSNMKLLLMGDFEVESARALIEELFAADATRPAEPAPTALWPAASSITTDGDDDELCTVAIQLPAPGVEHPDYAAFSLIADALSGDSGRIRSALDDHEGLSVQEVSVGLEHRQGRSLMDLRVECASGTDTGAVIEVMLGELATMAQTGLRALEWTQARNRALSTSVRQIEQLHYYALMQGDLIWHSKAGFEARYQTALADSYDRMATVAHNWFDDPVLKLATIDPGATSGQAPFDTVAGGYVAREDAEPGHPLPGSGKVDSDVPMAHNVQSPTVTTLDNGITLIHSAAPTTRMFAIHVLVRDRSAREPAAHAGMADLLHRCLPLGAGDYDDEELASLLDGIGAQWKVTDSAWIPYDDYYTTDSRFSFIRLDCVDIYWKEAMRLTGLMLSDPSLEQESIDKARTEMQQRIRQDAGNSGARARALFASALFGQDSPRARPVFGEDGSLDAVDARSLQAFALDYLDPGQLVISIVGNVDHDAVLAHANNVLGFGAASDHAEAPASTNALTTEDQRHELDLGGQQSMLRMGRIFEIDAADRWALEVAAMIASDRMQQDLRETRGWAYSLGIGLSVDGDIAQISARMGTRPGLVDQAEPALADWLATGALEVSANDVAAAVNSRLGRMRMRRVTSIGQAFNLGHDWFTTASLDVADKRSRREPVMAQVEGLP
ncbi:hypothetical protein DRQ32_01670, partial [bacterium]